MATSPGIVVLDRSGRVGFTTESAAALLRAGDGLTVRGARLVGRGGGPGLEDAVQATLAEAPHAPSGPLRTVVLRRRDRLPLIASVTPLAAPATGALGALVLLHDPEQRLAELMRADLALAGRQEARVAVSEYPAGTGTPFHRHGDAHEIVYVLGGGMRGEWGEGESRLTGAGELLHYGPGLQHRGLNPGAATARLLVTRIARLEAV
jgi:quercetin dioxygenase-like cupin family protein